MISSLFFSLSSSGRVAAILLALRSCPSMELYVVPLFCVFVCVCVVFRKRLIKVGKGGGRAEEGFTITKQFGHSVIVNLREREREREEELVSKNRCLGFLGFGDDQESQMERARKKGRKKKHISLPIDP